MEGVLTGRSRELETARRRLFAAVPGSIVVTGAPGMGKTAFAERLIREATAANRQVVRIVATPAATGIPLGAFVAHLPPADGFDAGSPGYLASTLEYWRARASGEPLIMFVDDAHHLDSVSATLLHQLLHSGTLPILVTADVAEPGPGFVDRLWRSGGAPRIDLAPLADDAVDELVISQLGGADPLTRHTVRRLSAGNPRHVLALVRALLPSADGGPPRLEMTPELAELAAASTRHLSPGESDLLELVAIAGSLPVSVVEEIAGDALEALERRRLVDERDDGRRRVVVPGDPLVAAVIEGLVPHAGRRRLAQHLHDAVGRLPDHRAEDRLVRARIALWAGLPSDPEELTLAALHAWHRGHYPEAVELARVAHDDHGGAPAALVLGQALASTGAAPAADGVFADAMGGDLDDAMLTRLAVARARNLYTALRDIPRAIGVISAAHERVVDERCRTLLGSARSVLDATLGNWDRIRSAGLPLLADPAAPPEAVLPILALAGFAGCTTGRLAGIDDLIDRGIDLTSTVQSTFAGTRAVEFRMLRSLATAYRGDLAEAAVRAGGDLESAMHEHAGHYAGGASYVLGHVLALQGVPGRALDALVLASDLLEPFDPFHITPFALAEAAIAAVTSGRADRARSLLDRHDALAPPTYRRTPVQRERAAAWLVAKGGDLEEATRLAKAAGDHGRVDERFMWTAFAYYDAVRFGHAAAVADHLHDLAIGTGAELVALLADHAGAARAGEAAGLERVAERFEQAGAWLFAAEAASEAANRRARSGDTGRMVRAQAVRERLLSRLGPLWSPALRTRPQLLTTREFEIASMASVGATSRQIADRLAISVRTVDNHLASVYQKLGIGGRSELPRSLGLGPRSASPISDNT